MSNSSRTNPLLSIITVCYDVKADLVATINSIQSVKGPGVEYVVVDGGSTDGTAEVIQAEHSIDRWVSEPDEGIFDAMNKGIQMASGQWLLFINAGDEVRFDRQLVKSLSSYADSAVVYGDTERASGKITVPHSLDMIKSGGLPMCHQSTFYNSAVLKEELYYDTKYPLFGENELLMRIYKRGYKLSYIPEAIAYFQGGGVSDRISWNTRKARYYFLWKHFGIAGVVNGLLMKMGLKK